MDRGQIVFAPFLYSDLQGTKRRPACVVSAPEFNDGPDVVVAMVTSSRWRFDRLGIGDVTLEDWQAAGLPRRSLVRTGRLLVLEQRLIQFALGSVTARDLISVDRALRSTLGLGPP